MAEIRIKSLEKRYGTTAALRGIDVIITDGELLALLGPSGCGKTTTLQLLAGFLTPDTGEIWSGGRLVSSPAGVVPPERRNMAMVFQGYALWPHMTVAQNVAFGLETRRLRRDEIERRVAAVLEIVDLAGYQQRYPHELSGGQQQRVALARALVVRPDTLLLDEPLSNLDANLREQMRFEIRRIHQETGITMVYVTHDQTEAMVIADRIAVMNQGQIEQLGTPPEIYDAPRSRFVAAFIGQANCLPGELVEPGVVRCGDLVFRTPTSVGGQGPRPGEAVTLCIRPAAVRVLLASGDGAEALESAANGDNALVRGRTVRQAYLGDQQDLRVEIAGGHQVRALAPSGIPISTGEEVLLQFPRDACRVVRV